MREVKRYLAMDEGCYECGEPSGTLGTFDTREEAEAACERASERQEENWRGQHAFLVYDLTEVSSEWADSLYPHP